MKTKEDNHFRPVKSNSIMNVIEHKHKVFVKKRRAKQIPINEDKKICPVCDTSTITHDENRCEDYCTNCGLITRAAINYTGLRKVTYEYGNII